MRYAIILNQFLNIDKSIIFTDLHKFAHQVEIHDVATTALQSVKLYSMHISRKRILFSQDYYIILDQLTND